MRRTSLIDSTFRFTPSISSATSHGSRITSPTSISRGAHRTRAWSATSGSNSASCGAMASRLARISWRQAIMPGSRGTLMEPREWPGGSIERMDQSYVLFGLRRDLLPSRPLPGGGLHEIRNPGHCREHGLPVHDKPDSQEICFVPGDDYLSFVRDRRPDRQTAGPIVDEEGNRPGRTLRNRSLHDWPATGTGNRRGITSLPSFRSSRLPAR